MGVLALVGLIAGWLAGQVMKGGGYGVLIDIVLGILGGVLGGWIFGKLGIWHGGGMVGSIIVAFVGAVILVWVTRLLKKRSTLDVYTQAITPAKHAAQARRLVIGHLQAKEMNYRRQAAFHSEGEESAGSVRGEKGHKKGQRNVPFWVLDGFCEILTTLL